MAGLLSGQEAGEPPPLMLVREAREFVGKRIPYDGRYVRIAYPGGDPGKSRGGCTDLVIRSYRKLGIDLQVLVHEDVKKNFDSYPIKDLYVQREPDSNIDHRRVPNLATFFKRHGQSLTLSIEPDKLDEWRPGDIVVFDLLDNGLPSHVGIVSDEKADSGLPLVIHHFPPYPSQDDRLTRWKIVGHYRYFPEKNGSAEN